MNANGRYWCIVVILLAASTGLYLLSDAEVVPLTQPLATFPFALGPWQGRALPLEERIIEAVGVDDHLSRIYLGPDGESLLLYVGYYKSQRTGKTIHSPKNCLPGAGWQPVRSERLYLTLPSGERASANLYVIEKGLERQLVLYWYQSHGRVIASEYWGKFYMVVDAIRLNRTDSALVRIVASLRPDERAARQRAVRFAERALVELENLIPR